MKKYLYKILDVVVESCSYMGGSKFSITKEDILGKIRNENIIMTIILIKYLWLK